MADALEADLCVIGGGSGGLTVAAGAAQMGARVVLVERGRMGGDCLNYGCVPSKSLIAAAHAAEGIRRAPSFGIEAGAPGVDFARVHDHVHRVIAAIAPIDSVERFEGLGVTVLQGTARFAGPTTVAVGDLRVEARRVVIATGSSPAVPPIPGLERVPYLTNETVFDLRARPDHLIVVGGGPVGCEIAQALRRLGARVTLLETAVALGKDDPELAGIVKDSLRRDGVDLREGVTVAAAEPTADGVAVVVGESAAGRPGAPARIEGSALLVATGRRPNLADLRLEAAGIAYTPRGVTVDARLRTSNRRVYAIGDAAGPYPFTHMAGYQAGIVLRNALFRLPAKVDYRAVPWVTYTAPELAQVGMTEADARTAFGEVRVLRCPFADNDRAQAERATSGLVKVVTTRRGIVVGAGMVGEHAGELIQVWSLAIARRLHVKHVAGLILPYPTLGEVNKRAAGSYFAPVLFGARTRRLVRLLARLG
jgi:pyruvate/2-oxoglutarate dehydrogenase complex dihydrolipoamide dehydrogenase (E3) component